ncbi:SDR family NAD(P)-dependent oxidoreductase [Nitratifractor sp.]|uniref:SDR family NAD(P)-dependent oxidoreductase n=1 Tax=Nitratifractor sp. TaxID=2268144 RepID=UPI0025D63D36|nr:SDR family NAD(P)-dependent oxidoreductase [Nitratifractor sp.]
MENRLKGKTALITGAGSGIGEACARTLAAAGCHLLLAGRRAEKLEYLARELEEKEAVAVVVLPMDVTDRDAVERTLAPALERHAVDILINNAGLALGLEPLDRGRVEHWERMIDTNVKGLLYVTRLVMAQMRERDTGHILNLGSIAGETAYPGGNVYCATKAAVHMLSDAMNVDAMGTRIRVGTLAPGAVDTEFSDVRFEGDRAKRDAVYDGYTPLGARDIADLAYYVLNTPEHVNIQHVRIMPTAQRNPYLLYREES